MKLDLSSLRRALESLAKAVRRSEAAPQDEELRDAVIKRFEYSYELCWKMLKRQLESESPSPAEVDQLSFRGLIREGAERGLVADPEKWMEYRHQRNLTAHIYHPAKAVAVYQTALLFYRDALDLLKALERRNAD
jgi:nucleotidyltransferase substrate binding protein (TIGR01987 family)